MEPEQASNLLNSKLLMIKGEVGYTLSEEAMKKILFLGILLMGFGLAGQAQVKQIRFVNALPSVCISGIAPPVIYQGKLYQCTSGTYQLPGGGGIATGDSPTLTGAWVWSLSNAAAVAIGPNGNTNPTFRVVTNVASAATGLSITGNAAGSGVTLQALSSGANEDINIAAKGATGNIVFTQNGVARLTVNSSGVSTSGWPLLSGSYVLSSSDVYARAATARYVFGVSDDAAISRIGAASLRISNGSTGAGKLLLGTSSDTSAAQLDARSQTVGLPAAQVQCASGESATANCVQVKNGAGTTTLGFRQDGTFAFDRTITSGGTTGAQTINKSAFSVNFAAAATSLVVTNSVVATTSGCLCTVQTNDTTMTHVQAVPASGSVTLYANAAPTGETKVYCEVRN